MRLEHYSQEKLEKELLAVFGRHLDLNKTTIFFFGSRVNGGGNEFSDIDVGFKSGAKTDFLVAEAIRSDIEETLPTLYKIDVVNFSKVEKRFSDVALKHTETFWEPK